MNKHIVVPAGTNFDLLRHQAHAIFFQSLDCRCQIRHFQAHMVQTFSAPGDELRNRRILRRRFEKFEPALANRHHHQPYFFLVHNFFRRNAETELFINRLSRRQRIHRDSEMIDLEHQLLPPFAALSSTSVYGSRLCSATSLASSAMFPLSSCARAFSSMASRSISTSRSCQFCTLFFSARFSSCR